LIRFLNKLLGRLISYVIAPLVKLTLFIRIYTEKNDRIKFKNHVYIIASGPSIDHVSTDMIFNKDVIFINSAYVHLNKFDKSNNFFIFTSDCNGIFFFKDALALGIKRCIIIVDLYKYQVLRHIFDKRVVYKLAVTVRPFFKKVFTLPDKKFVLSVKWSKRLYGGYQSLRIKPSTFDIYCRHYLYEWSAPYTSLLSAVKYAADNGATKITTIGFDCCNDPKSANYYAESIKKEVYNNEKNITAANYNIDKVGKIRLNKINIWSWELYRHLKNKNVNWINHSPLTCISKVPLENLHD